VDSVFEGTMNGVDIGSFVGSGVGLDSSADDGDGTERRFDDLQMGLESSLLDPVVCALK